MRTLLIANRGEIACRIIRTARRMGIRTVAVFSDSDSRSLHVEQADAAIPIGAAPARESYLSIDKIISAAHKAGADAIHPGYGFLSERAAFASACEAAKIKFVGPPAKAIATLGDKISARKVADAAGVKTVPGLSEELTLDNLPRVLNEAQRIGYPIMIKAAAGGGGKGMRIARDSESLSEGVSAATREAAASFGDGRVFIEKYIEQPRHIEIQILADQHGKVLHFGERECSIQRRHQKVIEEAPSPFVSVEMRKRMGASAVALAKNAGYVSAGTAEFIVDQQGNFYFLEMNTRLQVEHPVTEEVYGIDLVEWMLRIAEGENLPFLQDEIAPHGHAIEARVYAEDPSRNFLPSTGRLTRCDFPEAGPKIRIETGVRAGSEISPYYDPMLAKIIGIGKTRESARGKLTQALDQTAIEGVRNNLLFLSALLHLPHFKAGSLSTNLIAENFGDSFSGMPHSEENTSRLIAVAVIIHMQIMTREMRGAFRHEEEWEVRADNLSHSVSAARIDQVASVQIGENSVRLSGEWEIGLPVWQGTINEEKASVRILNLKPSTYRLEHAGIMLEVQIFPRHIASLASYMISKPKPDRSKQVSAPMPGLLSVLRVSAGDRIHRGDELAIIEAMKMENSLKAETDGVIAEVRAKAGDSVAVDQVILTFA